MGLLMKVSSQLRRVNRVRSRLHGTAERPRLSVSFSNRQVVAQLIDDDSGQTVAYASSLKPALKGNLSQKAEAVAAQLVKQAAAAKVRSVVLDRRHKPYHGRVKLFAETARKQGLEF